MDVASSSVALAGAKDDGDAHSKLLSECCTIVREYGVGSR